MHAIYKEIEFYYITQQKLVCSCEHVCSHSILLELHALLLYFQNVKYEINGNLIYLSII